MNRIRTDVFKGLHKRDGAPEGAFLEVSGVTTADYPSMKTRPPRARIGEWENATDVYETDGHLIVIDDNKLYYDGTFLSNVGGTKKQFCEINRKLVIWPDKIYINLNTGELGSLEANIKGSATTTKDGTIYLSNGSTSNGKKFTSVAHTEYVVNEEFGYVVPHDYVDTYFITYSTVAYDGVKWKVAGRESGRISVGRYFIGSVPPTGQEKELDGTIYGKVTKIEDIARDYPPNVTYYDQTVHYELYDAGADGIGLENVFSVGEAVSIEGHELFYNNREAARVIAIGKTNITVDAAFLMGARICTVQKDYAPGTYKFVTRYANTSNEPNYGSVFTTYRTLRKGEQLFMVYDKSDGYGNTQGGPGNTGLDYTHVYCYDPVTKALDAFEVESTNATDMEEFDAVNNIYFATSTRNLTISRKVPDMEYVCERDNRLYGVSNAETETIFNAQTGKYETVTARVLHASALGEPSSWNISDGVATDSWAVPVAGEGDFTGIVSYSGSVIAFKENRMYKLTGDYPAEFYLRSYTVDGVKEGCHKSLAIINEVLYYLSPYGVMRYSGGVPSLVSYELGIDRYEEAVAGRDRMNYLIQMDKLYCYDTIHGLWVSEDYGKVTGIESVGNSAYIVTDGKIMQTDSGDEKVEWYAMTHFTDEGTFLHKDYQAMNLDAALTEGAEMKIEYRLHEEDSWKTLDTMTSYHGTEWQNRKTLNEAKRMHHKFTPGIQRCDRIQFRLSGKGACKIYAYDRVVRFESDKP